MSLTRGLVLDVANQLGGAMPGVVTLKDWSRYGNDGAINSMTWTLLPTGLWVMTFDGTNDYVRIPTSPSLDIVNAITIEFWTMRLGWSDTGSWDTFLAKGINLAYQVRRNAATARILLELTISGVNRAISTTIDFPINTWWHFVGTYNGTDMNIYLNGLVDPVPGNFPGTIDVTASNLDIGGQGASRVVNGYISRVRLRNYALTPAQIRARYHSSKWLFGVAS